MNKKLLYSLFALSICFFGNAQTYVLDNTFGTGGNGYTKFNSGILAPDKLNAAAATPDGNTVITGNTYLDGKNYFTVAKVTPTGYDTSFGGLMSIGYSGISLPVYQSNTTGLIDGIGKDIVVQPDGKIVAVGWQLFINSNNQNNGRYIIVTRLNADGTLDTSFNGTGIQTININGSDYANAVALQSDGKIVIGGYTENGNITNALVARLNTDGTLDTTFDNDGIVTFSSAYDNNKFNDIAVQTDGKIIVCGQNSANDFLIVRYNTDGTLDTSFNMTGIVYTDFNNSIDAATCLTIQPDFKIVVSGYAYSNISGDFAVARYLTNGSLDTSFSGDGKVSVGASGFTLIINSISISGNRIYLGGYYEEYTSYKEFFIYALTLNGNPDNFNNGNPFIRHDAGSADDIGVSFVKHGTTTSLFGYSDDKFSYYNLTTSNSFIYVNKLIETYTNLKLSKNSTNIYTLNGSYNNYSIAAFTNFGQNLLYFGGAGGLPNMHGAFLNNNDAVFEDTYDNNFLVSGNHIIYRYHSGGLLDTTLSGSGILNLPLLANQSVFIDDIVCLPNNSFFVITEKSNNDNTSLHTTVYKFNSNGTPDTNYGVNGVFEDTPDGNNDFPNKGVIDNDGKLIIVGSIEYPGERKMFTMRLNQNGTLDNSYGVNGQIIYNINGLPYPYATSIQLQNDGKLLVLINYQPTQQSEFSILRLNIDGSLDTTYNGSGIAHTIIPQSTNASASDFIILDDGKTLLSGSSVINGQSYLTLVRYNTNGTLDTTFGTNGVFQDIPDGISNYTSAKIRLENNDKITVVANISNNLTRTILLARYILDMNLGTIDFANTNEQSYIYPNPIIDETNLVYTLNKETLITVELYDLQGKLVKNYFKNELKAIGKHDEKLTLPNYLQAGNYILKISSSEGSNSIKLIKK